MLLSQYIGNEMVRRCKSLKGKDSKWLKINPQVVPENINLKLVKNTFPAIYIVEYPEKLEKKQAGVYNKTLHLSFEYYRGGTTRKHMNPIANYMLERLLTAIEIDERVTSYVLGKKVDLCPSGYGALNTEKVYYSGENVVGVVALYEFNYVEDFRGNQNRYTI